MNFNNILADFAIELDGALNLQDSFKALEYAIEALGFLGIAYTSIPIGLNTLENEDLVFLNSSQFSTSFLEHYSQANFAAADFTVKRIVGGDMTPMNWWFEEQKGILLKEEKHVIQVASSDYNIVNGISIPTVSTSQHIAGASVISGENNVNFNQLLDERFQVLQTIIRLFDCRIQNNIQYKRFFYFPLLNKLSEREKKVLEFTVKGESYKSLNDLDGMSSSMASNIRSNLFKKFNVKNASELAYIVGLHNIIQLL